MSAKVIRRAKQPKKKKMNAIRVFIETTTSNHYNGMDKVKEYIKPRVKVYFNAHNSISISQLPVVAVFVLEIKGKSI